MKLSFVPAHACPTSSAFLFKSEQMLDARLSLLFCTLSRLLAMFTLLGQVTESRSDHLT